MKLKPCLYFILPSLLGIFLFMIPINFAGEHTIPVAVLSTVLQNSVSKYIGLIITIIISISFLLGITGKFLAKEHLKNPILIQLCHISNTWLAVRAIAAICVISTFTQTGTAVIFSDNTGGLLLNNLLPSIVCTFLFASLLLPLLLDFGLLEFCGVLTSVIMRPLFTLPGRSSIDCLASWIGDGTIGVLLTNKQYIEGHYTEREAAVIGTTFSFVSLSFSLIVLDELKLLSYTLPFYLTTIIVGIICAIIMPRIPPLSLKKDIYYDKSEKIKIETANNQQTLILQAINKALNKPVAHKNIFSVIKIGFNNIIEMWFGVIPIVMTFGTIALVISEYTPLFSWLGIPFIPILKLLQIPDPELLSQAVVISFADMFLPAVLLGNHSSDFVRFFIACLSISQLIFMSEIGGLLMGSKIKINFKDLILVFLLRTLISMPIIAGICHFVVF